MTAPHPRYTPAEYLAIDEGLSYRNEYIDGDVYAMSGASTPHVVIRDNVLVTLHQRLRGGPCRPYGTDMRVRSPDSRFYTYPDVTAVCGPPVFDPGRSATLLNPSTVVEILSDATEAFDRGDKFARYRAIPSLRAYVLISQHQACVERFVPGEGDAWVLTEAVGLDAVLELPSAGCGIPHEGVDLSAPRPRLRRVYEPDPAPDAAAPAPRSGAPGGGRNRPTRSQCHAFRRSPVRGSLSGLNCSRRASSPAARPYASSAPRSADTRCAIGVPRHTWRCSQRPPSIACTIPSRRRANSR